MDDFAPPSGPPPPKAPDVPAGWAARWNDQYKEWFYVNLYTKKSQWEKPTAPVFPADDAPPPGAPPGYDAGNAPITTDTKKNPYDDHSGHGAGSSGPGAGSSSRVDEDARLAAQLQAEEDARARSGPGGAQPPPGYGSSSPYPQSNSPYPQSNNPYDQDMNRSSSQNSGAPYGQSSSPFPQDLPPREKKASGGLIGKLLGKAKASGVGAGGGHYPASHGGGYGHQQPVGYMQQGGYGGPPGGGYMGQPQGGFMHQGAYGYGGQPGYGAPPMGYGGAYPPQRRTGGGGMGMAGGAALGVGAGLLGGAMIANAFDDDHEAYQDGFQDGADFGDGGGDFDG